MRFCLPHWNALREAIAQRGLSALVADSGEKAASNLVAEVQEGRTVDNYDPLMAAHMAIVNNAFGLVGLALMQPNEDGSNRCPICFLDEQHAVQCTDEGCTVTTYEGWIDRAADIGGES